MCAFAAPFTYLCIPPAALLLPICTRRGRLYCCWLLHLIRCFLIAPAPFFRAAVAAICSNGGLPICLCMHAPPPPHPAPSFATPNQHCLPRPAACQRDAWNSAAFCYALLQACESKVRNGQRAGAGMLVTVARKQVGWFLEQKVQLHAKPTTESMASQTGECAATTQRVSPPGQRHHPASVTTSHTRPRCPRRSPGASSAPACCRAAAQ